MTIRHLATFILSLASLAATAQTAESDSTAILAAQYVAKMDSLSAVRPAPSPSLSNPYYFPLFAGRTLLQYPVNATIGTLPSATATFGGTRGGRSLVPHHMQTMPWVIADAYAAQPQYYRYNLLSEPSQEMADAKQETNMADAREEAQRVASEFVQVQHEQLTLNPIEETLDLSDFHIHVRRPNFWVVKGSFSTQFMQYYVSDNWYKGGENHVSMLGMFNFEVNYNNKQKLTFSNKLETKLGFQTSPSDQYHQFKTNADLLRLTNKLGIQASKHWYYTAALQSWTQFYKAYNNNSDTPKSDFMSPFESVLSVGMDYKLQKKRVDLTAMLSPAAVNLKYCSRPELVASYAISEGKHAKVDLGATMTFNMTLKLCQQVNWVTRLYAFYDYRNHIKAEWENTVNLKVNKYLSTKLFLYPRLDNSVTKKAPTDKYLQFNEYLSVGLDLNF